jgi:hypothetical protein
MPIALRAVLAPLAVLIALAGCDRLVAGTDAEAFHRQQLADARAVWATEKPASYSYDIDVVCGCIPASAHRTVRVTVTPTATTIEYADPNTPAFDTPPLAYREFATAEKLFDQVEAALERPRRSTVVAYDVVYAHPRQLNARFSDGDLLVFQVSGFQAVEP